MIGKGIVVLALFRFRFVPDWGGECTALPNRRHQQIEWWTGVLFDVPLWSLRHFTGIFDYTVLR